MSDSISINSHSNTYKLDDVSGAKSSKVNAAQKKKALIITAIVLTIVAGIALAATGGAFLSLGIVGAAVVPLLSVGVITLAMGLVGAAVAFARSRKKKLDKASQADIHTDNKKTFSKITKLATYYASKLKSKSDKAEREQLRATISHPHLDEDNQQFQHSSLPPTPLPRIKSLPQQTHSSKPVFARSSSAPPNILQMETVIAPSTTVACDPNTLDANEVKNDLKVISDLVSKGKSNESFIYVQQEQGLVHLALVKYPGVLFTAVNHGPFPLNMRDSDMLHRDLTTLSDMVQERKGIVNGLNLQKYPRLHGSIPKLFRIPVGNQGEVGFMASEHLPICSAAESFTIWQEKESELLPAMLDLTKLNSDTGFCLIDSGHFRPCQINGKWSLVPMNGINPKDRDNSSRPVEAMIGNLTKRSSMAAIINVARREWRPALTAKMQQRLQELAYQ